MCLRAAVRAADSAVVAPGEQARRAAQWVWSAPRQVAEQAPATADERIARLSYAVWYLAPYIHQVPVHVIPCVEVGSTTLRWCRPRGGVIIPAAWSSFMLAALGPWPGHGVDHFHLRHGREAAELLGAPFETVMQAALIPVAYSIAPSSGPRPVTRWTRCRLGRVVGRLGGGWKEAPSSLLALLRCGRVCVTSTYCWRAGHPDCCQSPGGEEAGNGPLPATTACLSTNQPVPSQADVDLRTVSERNGSTSGIASRPGTSIR